jgi:hypothetical protein
MPKSKVIVMEEEMSEDEILDMMDDSEGVDRLTKNGNFSLYYDLGEPDKYSLEDLGLDSYAFSNGGMDFD